MSFQDAIEEMRAIAQPYYILYRYPDGSVGVEQISHAMSYEFDRDRILSRWYEREESANMALLAYKLQHGLALTDEERETIAEALERYATHIPDEREQTDG